MALSLFLEVFLELKKEHGILKEAFREMSENVTSEPGDKRSDDKNVRMLQNEMKKLKDDYKQCMEAIKKETYERTKAETIAKLLQETLDEKNNTEMEIDDIKGDTEEVVDEESVTVEDTDGEWVSEEKTRKRKNSQDNITKLLSCKKCKLQFKSQSQLEKHRQSMHVDVVEVISCDKCKSQFKSLNELETHAITYKSERKHRY